jgi:hypothetical protein
MTVPTSIAAGRMNTTPLSRAVAVREENALPLARSPAFDTCTTVTIYPALM